MPRSPSALLSEGGDPSQVGKRPKCRRCAAGRGLTKQSGTAPISLLPSLNTSQPLIIAAASPCSQKSWRVDIDITNPEHADTAAKLADDQLGKTPLVRIGFAPKCVRIYRNGGGVRSRKLHPLEMYSGSGQIVGFGWHQKAGRPYLWPNASPLDLNADSADIPTVTQAQLNCFTNELFKFVPRRFLPTQHGRRGSQVMPQTIGERLRMLTARYGSWRHAASHRAFRGDGGLQERNSLGRGRIRRRARHPGACRLAVVREALLRMGGLFAIRPRLRDRAHAPGASAVIHDVHSPPD